MSQNLLDYLGDPSAVAELPRAALDAFDREKVAEFQLAAADRKLKVQAERIPAVARLVEQHGVDHLDRVEDALGVLFPADIYKSYDPAWVEDGKFSEMTRWIAQFGPSDLADVDLVGCDTLTDWCRRLDEQADILVCHSAGTSGVLSFVPRTRRDREAFASENIASYQPFTPDPAYAIRRDGPNDITVFTMLPRRQYRITSGIFDALEQRFQFNPVQTPIEFQSPEFAIAQGRIRTAERLDRTHALDDDHLVAAWRGEVERFNAQLPGRLERWVDNLLENYRDRRIILQGSFDTAWHATEELQRRGVANCFARGSLFAILGGVKDGSVLPPDWMSQVREAFGADDNSFYTAWGMSEVNTGTRQCPAGFLHFKPTCIPFLLDPTSGEPLPRQRKQTGRLAVLELVSHDNWGGMVSGDIGTIDWDRDCPCGRHGPMMDGKVHRA